MKRKLNSQPVYHALSPPSRRRGLKRCDILLNVTPKHVAYFAEAWIENISVTLFSYLLLVASFAEAWIENSKHFAKNANGTSPPSRRRGLKIYCFLCLILKHSSPPSRRRGLKNLKGFLLNTYCSRLLRGGVD